MRPFAAKCHVYTVIELIHVYKILRFPIPDLVYWSESNPRSSVDDKQFGSNVLDVVIHQYS